MEAIKKKMAALKIEKDNALDKMETAENQLRDANMRGEKVSPFVSPSLVDILLLFLFFFLSIHSFTHSLI